MHRYSIGFEIHPEQIVAFLDVSIAHYILILLILVTLGSLRYLISDPTCLVHVIGFPALSEKFDMTT